MSRRAFLAGLVLASLPAAAPGQSFTPQSSSGLNVSFTTERSGPSRVLIFGDIRNTTNAPAEHVIVMAEGLDESGHVVSRGRGYVTGTVLPRGTSSFEIRLLAAGSEKRYRVQIEAFQFVIGN